MPSEVVDQRRLTSFSLSSPQSSFFSEEVRFPAQRRIGFWKTDSSPDHHDGIPLMSESQAVSSSPMERLTPVGENTKESLEPPQALVFKEQKSKLNLEHHIVGAERASSLSVTSWRAPDRNFHFQSNRPVEPEPLYMEGNKVDMNRVHHEHVLFSSSLPAMFNKKLKLTSDDAPFGQSNASVHSIYEEDEPFESLEELEAQTIGNLLPNDDDDLLSGVIDDLNFLPRSANGDEVEDDIFCSVGGLELEVDDKNGCYRSSEIVGGENVNDQDGGLSSRLAGEHPNGEHPSRTLFVRNINSNVEDSELRALFEQYGDISTLYTTCKHRGFVMISYYDIRAARNAMVALQNKPLGHRKLDIHFSIPKDNPSGRDLDQGTVVVFNLDSSVSSDDLQQIFAVYGEIKAIRATPDKQHKIIEFYDVRAAEAALCALNMSNTRGESIKLEVTKPGGARWSLMQQFPSDGKQKESSGCRMGSPSNSSPSVSNGLFPREGAMQSLHSAIRGPFSPFMETDLKGISSGMHHIVSSPVRIASVGNHSNQSGPAEVTHSMGQQNLCSPSFHPNSLPEFHNGHAGSLPYINSRPGDGIENIHFMRVDSSSVNSHGFEHNEAFGAPANGSCPLHGHQFVWNNANAYHSHRSGPMMWPNSAPFMSSISAHPPTQMHGLPRAPSPMMNSVLPLHHHHHVGSAPAVNPSLWERRHTYVGDSIEPSAFHPGSLGSMGFSGGSPLHPMELAHNIFQHAGGNCMDHPMPLAHIGIPSPQQRCHMFHGRSPMVPMPAPYDAPSDRVRTRRTETSASQADMKKQYELDIDRVFRGDDSRTTLMIKNIPNKYTSKMLLAAIDENHRGTYDFIYLPIDFKNKCNVGYAFINLTDPQHIIPFSKTFNGKKWEKFNSEKVASLAYARIQGKSALIAHFQNSSLMNEDKRCRPILFHSDGPNAGDQEPFPMGVNIRSRPSRSRTPIHENHEESPSHSPQGEESSDRIDSSSGPSKDT
ncbi:protein MEI2-like 4 [Dioscorea cayenensis subsp. rotundata]|uniref:Protein MEI2-like 4 n=1 Tax=Dioscorea cayennensis subsp. rotundata TaxID=55577 RepID=A0AB40CCZ5_DIOCR|nr:protein MEI2-like 4 [Dioscorea cayenensis subsp. rotundata]